MAIQDSRAKVTCVKCPFTSVVSRDGSSADSVREHGVRTGHVFRVSRVDPGDE